MAGGSRHQADSSLMAALACGATVANAADTAGVSRRTAHRRLADADFRRQVEAARASMVERALTRLCEAATVATDTLHGLLGSEDERVRLRASVAVLSLCLQFREAVEVGQQVDELRARLDEMEKERCAG